MLNQTTSVNYEIRNSIRMKYDGIKYYESYTSDSSVILCYLIFDENNVWKVSKQG